ncbi:MAG: hypothetical protein DME20_00795 [Verrucomicrobia bacterium]|nr:MAG: hypothetical protein DME20_00795 [Verrucomicrobiota bacterium]
MERAKLARPVTGRISSQQSEGLIRVPVLQSLQTLVSLDRSGSSKAACPSLAKPGTVVGGAGGGRLNVYDAIKSSEVHAATFRARQGQIEGVLGPPVTGIFSFGDPVRLTLSSLLFLSF